MNKTSPLGVWSLITTYLLFVYISINYGGYSAALSDMSLLISGDYHLIEQGANSFIDVLLYIVTLTTINLPLMIPCILLIYLFSGKNEGGHGVKEAVGCDKENRKFANLWFVVTAEELAARWLFLGVLSQWLTGPVWFYILFILGNGIWALVHLFNYKRKEDRQVIRVLPQFISGLFFTCIYVKFGLIATILCHFIFNSVLFTVSKNQNTNGIDLLQFLLSIGYFFLGSWCLDKPLSDLFVWFDYANVDSFAISGWNRMDYMWAALTIGGATSAIFDFALYDRGEIGDKEKEDDKDTPPLGTMLILTPFFILGIFLLAALFNEVGYWATGFIAFDIPTRIFLLVVVLGMIRKSSSYSGASRQFWSILTVSYITACLYQAVSLWDFIVVLAISCIFAIPKIILDKLDD